MSTHDRCLNRSEVFEDKSRIVKLIKHKDKELDMDDGTFSRSFLTPQIFGEVGFYFLGALLLNEHCDGLGFVMEV